MLHEVCVHTAKLTFFIYREHKSSVKIYRQNFGNALKDEVKLPFECKSYCQGEGQNFR